MHIYPNQEMTIISPAKVVIIFETEYKLMASITKKEKLLLIYWDQMYGKIIVNDEIISHDNFNNILIAISLHNC
jgi:hypothetical protein